MPGIASITADGVAYLTGVADSTGAQVTVYSDAALTSELSLPVVVNMARTVYVAADGTYRTTITDGFGAVVDADYVWPRTHPASIVVDIPAQQRTQVARVAAPGGRRVGVVGASISNGSNSSNATVTSYRAQVQKRCGSSVVGGIVLSAHPGQTSSYILTRMPEAIAGGAEIILLGPDFVTNSISNLFTVDQLRRDFIAAVRQARDAGLKLVACTNLPKTSSAGAAWLAVLNAYNVWLRSYCVQQGIPLADVYRATVDPTTGYLLAAYDSGDGVHPNDAGHDAIAAAIASVLTAAVGTVVWPVVAAGNGLLLDPLMTTTAQWAVVSGSDTTKSLVAASNGDIPVGGWVRHSLSNSGGSTQKLSVQRVSMPAGTWSPGDTCLWSFYVRASVKEAINKIVLIEGTNIDAILFEQFPTASPGPMMVKFKIPSVVPSGFYRPGIVVAAPAYTDVTLDIGACDVFNLTRLGITGAW